MMANNLMKETVYEQPKDVHAEHVLSAEYEIGMVGSVPAGGKVIERGDRASSRRIRLLPINPAPPVTIINSNLLIETSPSQNQQSTHRAPHPRDSSIVAG